MENEEKFGKGGLKDTLDVRDYKFSQIAGSLPPFDWNLGYDIEKVIGKKIKVKDQNGSGSCGGQAWAYYGEVIDPDYEEKSAKFIYAQTHVLPAGSAGRTNCELVVNKGWGDESLTPSYDNGLPPSEIFMQDIASISNKAFLDAFTDRALSYANTSINIDAVAQALRENKGVIIGITGKNNGTWTSIFPIRPNVIDNNCWNHWVYIGKAKLINGKKYVGFLNSWSESVGEKGWQWISEEYLQYPYVWSTWTMVYNFPKPVKYIFTQTMKVGSVGNEVMELQRRLNILPLDGKFGKITKTGVIKYQLSKGLIGDGIVGKLTRVELNK